MVFDRLGGYSQILEAMQELRHGSVRITEESGQVREASATVQSRSVQALEWNRIPI